VSDAPFPGYPGQFQDPVVPRDPLTTSRWHDPLGEQLNAVERSAEDCRPIDHQHIDDIGKTLGRVEAHAEVDQFLDPTAQTLGRIEDQTERSVISPEVSDGGAPTPRGLAPSCVRQSQLDLRRTSTFDCYHDRRALRLPDAFRRSARAVGASPGSGRDAPRRCPASGDFVDEELCRQCDQWGDHGSGEEQCYYDWLLDRPLASKEDGGED